MTLLIILAKTIFFYIFIIICYRIMGKREIGELSICDLTISILIAELVAISIEESKGIIYTVFPIVLLVILEIVSAILELKNNKLRNIIDGKPSVIINNKKLNYKEMIKQRYSINDLLISLRNSGISDIRKVNYAILETNGKLSIIRDNNYPLPLIIDGVIDEESLINIKKTKEWLFNKLNIYGVKLNMVLYAFYKDKTIYIIKK